MQAKDEEQVLARIARKQMRKDLEDCIAELPPGQRNCILMWEEGFGELTLTDIAKATGVSVPAVHKQKEAALLRLRQCMSNKEYA
jgi:DNA-directed RNA polymerase specialized sigma24 family protein